MNFKLLPCCSDLSTEWVHVHEVFFYILTPVSPVWVCFRRLRLFRCQCQGSFWKWFLWLSHISALEWQRDGGFRFMPRLFAACFAETLRTPILLSWFQERRRLRWAASVCSQASGRWSPVCLHQLINISITGVWCDCRWQRSHPLFSFASWLVCPVRLFCLFLRVTDGCWWPNQPQVFASGPENWEAGRAVGLPSAAGTLVFVV